MLSWRNARRPLLRSLLAGLMLSGGVLACEDAVAPERLIVLLATVPDTLDMGDSLQMYAGVTREGNFTEPILDRQLTWTTSDPLVATVDQTGKVKPHKPGAVTITAKTGINSASKSLVVANPIVVSIAGPDTITLGGFKPFTVTVKDRNQATVVAPAVTWTTPDTLIGRVFEGGAYARGYGSFRIIATYGSYTDTMVVRVPLTPLVTGVVATNIYMGWFHKCLLTASGQAYCSGSDQFGQRGDGDVVASGTSWTPVLSDVRFVQIESGEFGTCGISTDQKAYCWGANSYHEHSPIDTALRSIKTPRAIETEMRFLELTSTEHGQTCLISTANVTYCFGHNDLYQLDREPLGSRVGGLVPLLGGHALKEVDGNGFETCGVDTAGAVWCWGTGGYVTGKFPSASNPRNHEPNRVSFPEPLRGVALGNSSACALTAAGTAVCWGEGAGATFGNGSRSVTFRTAPEPVVGGLSFAMLAGSANSYCGITTTSDLYCWGSYIGFREMDNSRPARVASEVKFRHVSGNWLTSEICAVSVAGETYCFKEFVQPTLPAASPALVSQREARLRMLSDRPF